MKGGKGGRPRKPVSGSPARSNDSSRRKPPTKGSGGKPTPAGAPKKGSRKRPDVGGSASAGEE